MISGWIVQESRRVREQNSKKVSRTSEKRSLSHKWPEKSYLVSFFLTRTSSSSSVQKELCQFIGANTENNRRVRASTCSVRTYVFRRGKKKRNGKFRWKFTIDWLFFFFFFLLLFSLSFPLFCIFSASPISRLLCSYVIYAFLSRSHNGIGRSSAGHSLDVSQLLSHCENCDWAFRNWVVAGAS